MTLRFVTEVIVGAARWSLDKLMFAEPSFILGARFEGDFLLRATPARIDANRCERSVGQIRNDGE